MTNGLSEGGLSDDTERMLSLGSIPSWAKWCQPGDKQDERYFIVRFEDRDRSDAVFTDIDQAYQFYARATVSWNCWLFGAMPAHPTLSRRSLPGSDAGERTERSEALDEFADLWRDMDKSHDVPTEFLTRFSDLMDGYLVTRITAPASPDEAQGMVTSERVITLFDWAWTDETGEQRYARTPERAERLKAQGFKLTPVYTVEAALAGHKP